MHEREDDGSPEEVAQAGLDPGLKLVLLIPVCFVVGLLVLGLSVAIDWQW